MVECVLQWVIQSNGKLKSIQNNQTFFVRKLISLLLSLSKIVSVQLVSLVVGARLILTNVHRVHVTMVEFVLIYRKAIAANVCQATPVRIVKKKKQAVRSMHVQRVPCAKMSPATEIIPVYVAVDTPAMSVTLLSIHAPRMATHARMALIASHCNKVDSSVIVYRDGMANCVTITSTIVLRIHACLVQIVPI